jgi:hypothetical protein
MKRLLYKVHRRLALVVSIPVLLWTLSGVLHAVMMWVEPKPAAFAAPQTAVRPEQLTVALKHALAQNGIGAVRSVRFVSMGQQRYLDVATGEELPDGDRIYAEFLARHFGGEPNAPLASATVVTDFGREYTTIRRLLPVYRVELDRADRLCVFVDTSSSRLGAVSDGRTATLQWLFCVFHTWDVIQFSPSFRLIALGSLSALIFAAAFSGLLIYGAMYRKLGKHQSDSTRLRTRRWHRLTGLAFSATMLLAASSGSYHALYKFAATEPSSLGVSGDFAVADFRNTLETALAKAADQGPVIDVGLVEWGGQSWWRFTLDKQSPVYVSTQTGRILEAGDHAYARHLASQRSGISDGLVASVTTVTRFDSEFGFIQRRLPVVKVQYQTPENVRYYIETSTGVLAWQARDADAYERYSFAYLHKWGFANGLGTAMRDGLMVAFTLGSALVAGLGIVLLVFCYRPQGSLPLRRRRAEPESAVTKSAERGR